MSTYAIGDLQGCYDPFHALLEKIDFNPDKDLLYLVGDLVNRGTQSLQTLRLVRSLGDSVQCVLGNHEIFLLRLAAGLAQRPSSGVLDELVDSPDFPELVAWLRQQPLMILDEKNHLAFVHAGFLPEWDFNTAKQLAQDIEKNLRNDAYYYPFLKYFDSRHPNHIDAQMDPKTKLYAALNVMTRIRFCDKNSTMDFDYKGPPGTQAHHLKPWFEWPHRRDPNYTLAFGHWASLGFLQRDGILALDTGCIWGRELTAYRLDSGAEERISISCADLATRLATTS
ncbi:MAG: symmetrical bis(5'-nucleosyl)-tetraphosphatase [Candidatus Oxydemutatoraceae bacterium WSBS_2016_MAG_OTU14]